MTQTQAVLQYLDEYGSITPLDALRDLGCFRLAAVIHKIEKTGIRIPRKMKAVRSKKTGKQVHIMEYFRPENTGDR